MRRRGVWLLGAAIVVLVLWNISPVFAQTTVRPCVTVSNAIDGCKPVSATVPMPISGSISLTFPTIGAAVPSTGVYEGINVAGTLRGVTGLALGSTFSQTMAIVDASGNQITSFGSSAAVSATGAAVPASANYIGINVAGTLTGWTGAITNTTFGATVTSWGGGTLGAMANYGTSPGAVLVPGVNAFITNTNANGRATPVNSSPVVLPATPYETVAASQTGQALGATGATGDYLSHCVIYPVTTSPGVVTVFDSTSSATNNVITFAGGSSSLSNLAPISIPVGAVSVNGAWKVTTGTNVLAICYGNFT